MLLLSFRLHLLSQGIDLVEHGLVACLGWCLYFLSDGRLVHAIAVRAQHDADEDNNQVAEPADITDRCQERILGLSFEHVRRAAHLHPRAVRRFQKVLLDVDDLVHLLVVTEELELHVLRKDTLLAVLNSNLVFLQLEDELVLVAARVTLQRQLANHVLDRIVEVIEVDALLHDVEHGVNRLVSPKQALVRV